MTFGGIEETIKSDVINIQQLRSQLELNNFKISAITDLDIMANSNDFDTIYVGNVFIKQGRNLFLVHDLRSDFRKLPIPVNIRFEDEEGENILYTEIAELDELVKSVFRVEISHLTIIEKDDIDGILGGVTFTNEYNRKEQREMTEVHNYSCSVEHLIKDY